MNARRGKTIRRSFTLTELLVVIMVISILASSLMFAMYNAVQQAKESRTKAQITKLHELLMTRWDSYRTRAVRLQGLTTATRRDARAVAQFRLFGLRDLMRLELPERTADVVDAEISYQLGSYPAVSITMPACAREYRRRVTALDPNTPKTLAGGAAVWTGSYQGAECLYMIIASMQDITGNALDFLQEGEVGDIDSDGMPEIWDAWGNPIEFLRWAPGYFASPGPDGNWGIAGVDDDSNSTVDDISEALSTGSDDMLTVSDLQKRDPLNSHDPFDPLRIFADGFSLYPLIFSAGPDGRYDISNGDGANPLSYTTGPTSSNGFFPNNPYHLPNPPDQFPVGTPMDANTDGELSFMDNIVNHALGG